MACAGNCTLCGKPRDKVCRCLDRGGKQIDPIHPSLAIAEEYMAEQRHFGRKQYDAAIALIEDAVKRTRSLVANKELDGRQLTRIGRDAERLERKAKGRVFGSGSTDCSKHVRYNPSCIICKGKDANKGAGDVSKAANDDVMSRLRQRRELQAKHQ